MNERIRELMNQAMDTFSNGYVDYKELNTEKFAELIVKECANRATWAQDTGAEDVGGEVLKHFGVEE